MLPSFVDLPSSDVFVLRNATLPAAVVKDYAAPARLGEELQNEIIRRTEHGMV